MGECELKEGDRLKIEDLYVCVKCRHKIMGKRYAYGKKPRKCPKCGGVMVKMIVLEK